MQKVLISGAAGFFASRFYNLYRDKYNLVPLKRNDLDIRDEKKVLHLIKKIKPDFVLHTAAIADTGMCERDRDSSYNINVLGSINIAKACSIVKAKMIHLSTEQLYNGNAEPGPYSEETIPIPNTIYGMHKLQAEEEINKILEEAFILRLTWLFGFPERYSRVNPNIIMNILSAALKGEKLKIPTNEYRGMTYVYNLLDSIPKILELPYGTYNAGSENNLSTYEIAENVVDELGLSRRKADIIEKDEEKFKDKPRDLRISNKKLKTMGIEFLNTKEAVLRCVKEFGYILK